MLECHAVQRKALMELLCKFPDLKRNKQTKKDTLVLTRASFFIFYTGEYFIQSKNSKEKI